MRDAVAALLEAWMPLQRWYSTKNLTPRVASVEEERLATVDDVVVARLVVCDEAPGEPVVYQVPVTLHPGRADLPETALIGVTADGWLYDGCADPRHAAWMLRQVAPGLVLRSARVLTGEQSNTSVICDVADPEERTTTAIAKIFRVLADGPNPDIELQEALSRAGTLRVPHFIGALRGSWTRRGARESGDLAVAQEFIPGARDAWRVALDCVATGSAFDARGLGAATAEVHSLLAAAFGTQEPTASQRAEILDQWHRRTASAVAAVPSLGELEPRVDAVFRAAAEAPWPALQRVHGDLHLGQVIHGPGRGWVLLDFEGEPLRPLAQRRLPDLALRDVAGMLRSFDYAAASAGSSPAAAAWARQARQAFLDGYADVAPDPRSHPGILAALELDKALYEALYGARNRPSWLWIPLAAVGRLLD